MHHWIANLRFRHKFGLLGLLFAVLVGIPTVMVLQRAWAEWRLLESERSGLRTSEPLLEVIRYTQEHRGLSAGVLSGNAAMQAPRAERQKKVNELLTTLGPLIEGHASREMNERHQQLLQRWQAIEQALAGGQLTAPDSFKQHNALIQTQIDLLSDVGEVSGLALDADPRSYFMIVALTQYMPRATDMLGKARAKGTAIRSKGTATADDLLTLRSLADGALALKEDTISALHRAARYFEGGQLPAELLTRQKTTDEKVDSAIALVGQITASGGESGPEAKAYFDTLTAAILSEFAMSDEGMKVLDALMASRVKAVQAEFLTLSAAVAVLFALGAFVMHSVARSVIHSVEDAMQVSCALAAGDLSRNLHSPQRDEVGDMINAMGQAVAHMRGIIESIKVASDSVATAATQIAQGNQDLSARTESQASSLQQTASSMEQMSSMVQQTATTAHRSRDLSASAAQEAVASGEVFQQVVQRMESIRQASAKIADINAVIDGIAFQTNILALNAAVEAARAGEQGRGFAVVASEVRSLAQRSTQAAREIKTLIQQSVDSVAQGYELASSSTEAIDRLVGQVKEVSSLMSEIAMGSEQQSLGISQVNEAVSMLDQGTQQNAALVEESSAAAISLRDQASRLQQSVASFRLA
ncbi:methyl-accepting chemotaxis protein [Aquabacterium lacunae]|uniref:Methyl-accepting chemotaxis protein n=1 Tax=Aquabacterium lacunae TaxID=2528630 RepID=A0A4Q9H452_9BURK|nr:methyl-accepting chemotaxis protein [Aquabacterium lacunae]TBO31316.1 methyl-accepting chemotaxis protein [Aquabacterium lacunae]